MTSTPNLKRSLATSSVSPKPHAAFSPLAITKSTRWRSTTRCSSRERAWRPALPTISPMNNSLTGILYRPGLTNSIHLYMAGIGHLRLDLLGNILGQNNGALVADVLTGYHDPDLAARLNGKRVKHSGKGTGNALQVFKALDVGFHHLPAGAGSCAGKGIGCLYKHRHDRLRLFILMMGHNRMDNLGRFAVFFRQISADDRMGALNFVIDGLAQVVKKSRPLGLLDIDSKLCSHYPAQEGNLQGVLIDVLAV